MQQALLRIALVGDVGQRADDADHLAVRPHHGPRPQAVAEIMPIRRAQAEFLIEAAPALLQQRVETGAVAILLERMQQIEPGGSRAFEPAAVESQRRLGLGADIDVIGRHVPVEDDLIGAGHGQRLALHVADRPMRRGRPSRRRSASR